MNGGAWGGSEELWYQTALYAARNGYTVGCAFYDWEEKKERIEQLTQAGCKLYLFSNKGRLKRTFSERLQYKITKRKVRHAARSLPLQQYDMTVVNLGYLEIIDHYWKGFFPYVKNYTLLFHVYDENDTIKASRKALLRKWILHAQHNLFASMRIKNYLEQNLDIQIPNAATLINPVSFPAPEQQPPYPPLHNGNYLFVMIATLDTRRKAQDNLIKTLSSQKWKERNWQLYLYGGGESEQSLRDLIRDLQLQDKVVLKGHTRDVKGALAEAHLLLQMTHIDAMPLAVMEAMAMAKPLVVSNVGDMPHWVEEEQNGWISADASVESMDATLETCWQQKNRWKDMGRHSYQLFKEKFPAVPEAYFLQQVSS